MPAPSSDLDFALYGTSQRIFTSLAAVIAGQLIRRRGTPKDTRPPFNTVRSWAVRAGLTAGLVIARTGGTLLSYRAERWIGPLEQPPTRT